MTANAYRALWLVRHALPVVAPGTCYGRLDLAADPDRTQEAARALADALPQGAVLSVSPSQRCVQLAEALHGLRSDLRATPDARLQEMDFGQWEGKPWQQIPRDAIDAWTQDFFHHAPGGGETVAQVMQRVAQAWDAALRALDAGQGPQVWISHAGVARAAQLLHQGIRTGVRADQWPVDAPDYGDWRILAV